MMLFVTFVFTLLAVISPLVTAQRPINASPKGRRTARDLTRYRDPLEQCEKDCDRDYDCKDGLVCYLRNYGKGKGKGYSEYHFYGGLRDMKIPGCPAVTPYNYDDDYCIDPHDWPANTLWYIGSDGHPETVYPLKECWGDCDKDEDCAPGLKCFHRDGYHPYDVPGCNGHPNYGIDYCYQPPTAARTKAPTPRPTNAPTQAPTFPALEYVGNCNRGKGKGSYHYGSYHYRDCDFLPLDVCQGDCDYNSDCADGLVCLNRFVSDSPPIYGCSGTPRNHDPLADYCIDPKEIPSDNKYLIYWGNDRHWPDSIYPFGRCQGDCDYDSDCKPGLHCVGADYHGKIPGCEGYVKKRMHYCV